MGGMTNPCASAARPAWIAPARSDAMPLWMMAAAFSRPSSVRRTVVALVSGTSSDPGRSLGHPGLGGVPQCPMWASRNEASAAESLVRHDLAGAGAVLVLHESCIPERYMAVKGQLSTFGQLGAEA